MRRGRKGGIEGMKWREGGRLGYAAGGRKWRKRVVAEEKWREGNGKHVVDGPRWSVEEIWGGEAKGRGARQFGVSRRKVNKIVGKYTA